MFNLIINASRSSDSYYDHSAHYTAAVLFFYLSNCLLYFQYPASVYMKKFMNLFLAAPVLDV